MIGLTKKNLVVALLSLGFFGFTATASAQPTGTTSGADCDTNPADSVAELARRVRDILANGTIGTAAAAPAASPAATPPAAAAPAPAAKAKDFAEKVMKTVLDDKKGKDRWGYTSDCRDGCYARSYATNYDMSQGKFGAVPPGIKFKTIYVFWKPPHKWSYHTAAVVSGPDGDFVVDGLNGNVMTADEWLKDWGGPHMKRSELKDGIYMYPGETHDGKPSLTRREDAHDTINERKKLVPVPTHPYEP